MFSLQSVKHIGAAVLRVTIGDGIPISKDSRQPHDVLNPLNWLLVGTEQLPITVVRAVSGNPHAYDLIAEAPLGAGQWQLRAADIRNVSGETLLDQVIIFDAADSQDFFTNPRDQPSAEDVVRQAMAVTDGPGWRAMTAALGRGDQLVRETAEAAWRQMFLATAGGTYLERLTTSYGVDRPADVGLDDDGVRRLTMALNANKVVSPALEAVLEAYYGIDATRISAQSRVAEPFALAVGDVLACHVDGTDLFITLVSDDGFASISSASAREVAVVLNRELAAAGLQAYATPYVDPATAAVYLRIYSGIPGFRGRLQFFGGQIWEALKLPAEPLTTQAVGTQWSLQPSVPHSGIPGGRVRMTWIGGPTPNIQTVFTGDYVNIFGPPFLAANRGIFRIVDTTATSLDFEADPAFPPVAQGSVTQVGDRDIFFTRPSLVTPDSRLFAAVTRPAPNYAEIVLPATTPAVTRTLGRAWYIGGAQPVEMTSLVRNLGSQTVTVTTATPHGMSATDPFFLDSVEVDYDWALPALNVSVPAPFSMLATVNDAIRIPDGRVLAIDDSRDYKLYDPETNTWGTAAATGFAFSISPHPIGACVMPDGRIFACRYAEARIYDPATDVWVAAAAPPRFLSTPSHSMVVLPDGRIMVAGADNISGGTWSDVYDPATNTWSDPRSLDAVDQFTAGGAAVTPTGNVIWAGGGAAPDDAKAFFYNGSEKIWREIDSMPGGLSSVTAVFVPRGPGGQVWVTGGPAVGTIQAIYVLDLATLTWTSRPTLAAYSEGFLATIGHEVFFAGNGAPTWEIHDPTLPNTVGTRAVDGTTVAGVFPNRLIGLADGSIMSVVSQAASGVRHRFYASPRQRSSGRTCGQWRVAAVVDPTTFTFTSDDTGALQATAGLVTPCQAVGLRSGYGFDTKTGVSLGSAWTTLQTALDSGPTSGVLDVGDASAFTDEPGFIVFDYGGPTQSQAIRYLGIAGPTQLRIAAGQILLNSYGSGTTVSQLIGAGPYAPPTAADLGAAYLTSSAAGRVEATKDLEFARGAGLNINNTVIYPNDIGLGNGGQPTEGVAKLSDAVIIWGGDTVDAEAAEARLE